jgi:shikimate dehydrogenase
MGNPVAHSRSPFIHERFAQQTGVRLTYSRIEAPLKGFRAAATAFFDQGGKGLNITVPFKEQAYELALDGLSPRARMAGAVNTLWMENGVLQGCNTDGIGLLNDLRRLGHDPKGRKVLLVGAGGAAKGAVFPLLNSGCNLLHIVNRTPDRARDLHHHIAALMQQAESRISFGGLPQAGSNWDIVINATASSLGDAPPDLPAGLYAPHALAYDMMYGAQPTSFMAQARAQGADNAVDGLGMLVAQAAASFAIWHGLEPAVEPVLAELRRQLQAV